MMNNEERTAVYRGMIMTLACAIYNDEEGWDKGTVIGLLKMGDPESGHDTLDDPPEQLTDNDVADALDRIFERAGI